MVIVTCQSIDYLKLQYIISYVFYAQGQGKKVDNMTAHWLTVKAYNNVGVVSWYGWNLPNSVYLATRTGFPNTVEQFYFPISQINTVVDQVDVSQPSSPFFSVVSVYLA